MLKEEELNRLVDELDAFCGEVRKEFRALTKYHMYRLKEIAKDFEPDYNPYHKVHLGLTISSIAHEYFNGMMQFLLDHGPRRDIDDLISVLKNESVKNMLMDFYITHHADKGGDEEKLIAEFQEKFYPFPHQDNGSRSKK